MTNFRTLLAATALVASFAPLVASASVFTAPAQAHVLAAPAAGQTADNSKGRHTDHYAANTKQQQNPDNNMSWMDRG